MIAAIAARHGEEARMVTAWLLEDGAHDASIRNQLICWCPRGDSNTRHAV